MAKTVGFACSIKPQWLNKAVQLLHENLSEKEYKNALNEYLKFEIDSPTRLRKTREILMNIWYYDSKKITLIRKQALELIEKYPDDAAAIHLCMMYLAYPVVADIGKIMGRLFEFQDEITNAVLRQKLYDEWGERGTLETTTRRMTLTLKELGLLDCASKRRYVLKKQPITNEPVINFILRTAMKIDGNSYYPLSELNAFSLLFPFSYNVTKEQLMTDGNLTITNFSGELTAALKRDETL